MAWTSQRHGTDPGATLPADLPLVGEFEFRGLRCVASPDHPGTWEYLPARPRLRHDARTALAPLTGDGSSTFLTLWATWAPPDEDLDALRGVIAACLGEPDARQVRLSFAPIAGPECRALIGDGRGAFEPVATSPTSGVPPYDAVLTLALDRDRSERARAGLAGAPGFLAIEYTAELDRPTRARESLRAFADVASLLPAPPEPAAQGGPHASN